MYNTESQHLVDIVIVNDDLDDLDDEEEPNVVKESIENLRATFLRHSI